VTSRSPAAITNVVRFASEHLAFDWPLDEWLDAALAVEGLQLVELTRPIRLAGGPWW
jgi:hypothetical protein